METTKQMLNVNSPNSTGSMRIESDILEPVQSSQSYATFNIRRAGILSNDSRLVLPLYASNANTRLTAFGGCYSVIRTATLRSSSGVVIAQSDSINYLASMMNHYQSQEYRDKVGRYKNGTWNTYEYMESDDGLEGKGKYGLSNMSVSGPNRDQHARDRLGQSAASRVEYVISLKELFTELFPLSLPLFALEGNVQLFLEFSDNGPTGERAVSSDGNNDNIGDVLIDLDNLKFVSDHVFYPQPAMDRILQETRSSNGLVIEYGDFNQITFNHLAPADPGANNKTDKRFVSSVGMAGLYVKYMLFHNQRVSADGKPTGAQKIVGKYASTSDFAGVDGQLLQLQINNQNYYTQDLASQEFYRELEDVFGKPPSIPYPVYSTIGGVTDGTFGDGTSKYARVNRQLISDDTCFNEQMSELLGCANIIGVNFCNPLNRQNTGSNGIKVGNSPVQITYQRSYTNENTWNINQRVFCCVERLMSIRNGRIENNYS